MIITLLVLFRSSVCLLYSSDTIFNLSNTSFADYIYFVIFPAYLVACGELYVKAIISLNNLFLCAFCFIVLHFFCCLSYTHLHRKPQQLAWLYTGCADIAFSGQLYSFNDFSVLRSDLKKIVIKLFHCKCITFDSVLDCVYQWWFFLLLFLINDCSHLYLLPCPSSQRLDTGKLHSLVCCCWLAIIVCYILIHLPWSGLFLQYVR